MAEKANDQIPKHRGFFSATTVINTGFPIPAKHGRIGKAKVYDFKRKRHGKYYEQKRIEVFYISHFF